MIRLGIFFFLIEAKDSFFGTEKSEVQVGKIWDSKGNLYIELYKLKHYGSCVHSANISA